MIFMTAILQNTARQLESLHSFKDELLHSEQDKHTMMKPLSLVCNWLQPEIFILISIYSFIKVVTWLLHVRENNCFSVVRRLHQQTL